jgi:hypothetical protein
VLESQLNDSKYLYDDLLIEFKKMSEKTGERLDVFIDNLKKPEPTSKPKESNMKPIRTTREPWARVQARAEARHRVEYWEKRNKELETDVATLEAKIDARNGRPGTTSN